MFDDRALSSAAELLGVLSSPIRLRLLLLLEERPRRVTDLVDELGVSQPLVSRHLRVLREAGLVTGRREGREVIYEVADHHVSHVVADAIAHAAETAGHPAQAEGSRG